MMSGGQNKFGVQLRKGGNRAGGIRSNKADSGSDADKTKQLVESVRKHKNFKQLASYSVQCLQRYITPPEHSWERNVREAVECGAIEAISDVVKKHGDDDAVLAVCTACLTSISYKAEYSDSVVRSGAVEAVLSHASETNDDSDQIAASMKLLDTVTEQSAKQLVQCGTLNNITTLFMSSVKHREAAADGTSTDNSRAQANWSAIQRGTLGSLEKLNKQAGGTQAIIDSGALEAVLQCVQEDAPDEATSDGVLKPAFRILDRMCRSETNLEQLRKHGATEKLCDAIEKQKDNVTICRIGGRALGKLASGEVGGLVARMNKAQSSKERMFYSSLLANLAMEEDNADKIVKAGGVGALIGTLASDERKTAMSSARALGRIAGTEEGIDALRAAGGVSALIEVLNTCEEDSAVSAAVTPALQKLAEDEEGMHELQACGGVEAVLAAFTQHIETEEAAEQGVRFVEHLPLVDYEVDTLMEAGTALPVVTAMLSFPANSAIQLLGTHVLIYMANSEANVQYLVELSAIDALVGNLHSETRTAELVLASLYLLGSLSLVDDARAAFNDAGGMDALLSSIHEFASDLEVRKQAKTVVESLSDSSSVAQLMEQLQTQLAELQAAPTSSNATAVARLASNLGVLAIVEDFATEILQGNGLTLIVDTLKTVGNMEQCPMEVSRIAACG